MSSGTKTRNIRIDDPIWDALQAKAARNGDSASDVIRRGIVDYLTCDTYTPSKSWHADSCGCGPGKWTDDSKPLCAGCGQHHFRHPA